MVNKFICQKCRKQYCYGTSRMCPKCHLITDTFDLDIDPLDLEQHLWQIR